MSVPDFTKCEYSLLRISFCIRFLSTRKLLTCHNENVKLFIIHVKLSHKFIAQYRPMFLNIQNNDRLRKETKIFKNIPSHAVILLVRNIVVDPKLLFWIWIPFSSEFWIRILFSQQKVPGPVLDPILNINSWIWTLIK
jgi:hypothetical protein